MTSTRRGHGRDLINACLALILALGAVESGAHPAPFSYLDVHLDADEIHGTLTLHTYDAAYDLGLPQPERLREPGEFVEHYGSLTRLIDQYLTFTFDGEIVRPVWSGMTVLEDRDSLRFEYQLNGESPGVLVIQAQLFAYDPQHQTFVNVFESGALKHQAIVDAEHIPVTYYADSPQGRWSVVRNYLQSGVHHILIGPDHVLFLFGLLLLGGTAWRLAAIVTAFTLGHTVTLSLAVLGLMRISPNLVEPVIALSVVVVGVDNLLVQSKRGTADVSGSPSIPDLRPWLAAAFGLVHGFGFASVLQELGLPRGALALALAAFNIGVEFGQLIIVLVIASALWGLRRYSALLANRCVLAGSLAVVTAGAYWFVQRVFPAGW